MGNLSQAQQDVESMAKAAIEAAISLRWAEAVKINKKILACIKDDVEALNRLARAKLCLGEKEQAQKVYKKVLELDPYNIIAKKNLDKIAKANGNDHNINGSAAISHPNGTDQPTLANLFLVEPGKTKLVNLINLAPPSILATLNCGDQVLINPKNHSVSITTFDKVYLGALPDDLAHRLITFIGGGNKYDAYVKNATIKMLAVFIREIYRSAKFASQPSFQFKQVFLEDQESSIH